MTQRDCYDCYYSKLEGEKEPCKSCKSTDEGFTNWREVTLTNADRINAMSIEDKADFLSEIAYGRETPWSEPFAEKFCKSCPVTKCEIPDYLNPLFLHECDFTDGKCPHGSDIVWWLQQPADEDCHSICGATNLPCIRCNPGGCDNRKGGADNA